MKTRRLFFALWPPDELRSAIEHDTRALARRSGGRIIPARNLHITLMFLGSVGESRLPAAMRAADTVNVAAFALNLDRVKCLPGSGVMCLAPAATPPGLRALHDALRSALAAEEFEPERRPFRPHVTLVRRLDRLPAPVQIDALGWQVAEFVLVESRTGGDGSEYEILARWPLAAQS